MKILAIGDTHGKPNWKEIVNNRKNIDKIIFIGDYFDSFNISGIEQLKNFNDIINFKKNNINRVILLFGNHDFHYLSGMDELYSGFQGGMKYDFESAINNALKENLFSMCYIHNKYLFSHAGVTKTWCKNNKIVDNDNLEQQINDLFIYTPRVFKFQNSFDRYGNDPKQSPIWVRPESLNIDKLGDYIYVVGHTHVKKIHKKNNIILIDVLDTENQYLLIEDNVEYIKTIN